MKIMELIESLKQKTKNTPDLHQQQTNNRYTVQFDNKLAS